MNISKNIFLYSYALYLFICIFLVVLNKDSSYINDLISSIAIASTSISFAELFYTKTLIDKKEREQLISLYNYMNMKSEKIINEIYEKYKEEAKNNIALIEKVFDEKEFSLILEDRKYYDDNKEKIYKKINESLENQDDIDKLNKIIDAYMENNDIEDFIDNDKEDEVGINKGLKNAIKREKRNLLIANAIIILGFTAFFVVLTIDNIFKGYTSVINNFLTVFAFLSVILNVIIKDNYKRKSLKEIAKEREELLLNR